MSPVLHFPDARRWRAWLARNHRSPEGVWLKLAKKGSPVLAEGRKIHP